MRTLNRRTVALMVPCLANRRPKPLFPLINSGSEFLYDVTSFLPRPPLKCLIQSYAHNQFAYSDHAGVAVIRTVWLAVLCLIGLGATVATAGPPTLPSNVGASSEQ